MNRNDLINLFREASKRLSEKPDGCGNLIYTQKTDNKSKIREPEGKFVIANVLSDKKISFGIEVPTNKTYRFTQEKGKIQRLARTDLSILTNGNQINIELKEGQPNINKIEKDFEKLLREEVSGVAFFHILQNSNSRTLRALLDKYKKAYINKLGVKEKKSKWFVLFIFIKEKQECNWKSFEDITKISWEFNQNNLSKESASPNSG